MIIQKAIEAKLQADCAPTHLHVINESSSHNVPANSETHFKVIVVSDVFAGLSAVKRQQRIYGVLKDELAGEVHALTMQTLTPDEWSKEPSISQSPPCLGGENRQ